MLKLLDPLEVEICRFLTFIDALLIGKISGWRPFETGLRYDSEVSADGRSAKVRVVPVDWPDGSYIYLVVRRSGIGATWELHGGTIVAPHLEISVPFFLPRRLPTFLILPTNPAALGARRFTEALEQAGIHV